jgi:hypothetical protein
MKLIQINKKIKRHIRNNQDRQILIRREELILNIKQWQIKINK